MTNHAMFGTKLKHVSGSLAQAYMQKMVIKKIDSSDVICMV